MFSPVIQSPLQLLHAPQGGHSHSVRTAGLEHIIKLKGCPTESALVPGDIIFSFCDSFPLIMLVLL